jgi:hypothetical protein
MFQQLNNPDSFDALRLIFSLDALTDFLEKIIVAEYMMSFMNLNAFKVCFLLTWKSSGNHLEIIIKML